jgi:ATP-dependent Zn protease
MLAEELLFGREHASAGHSSDIDKATSLAARAIRELNYGEFKGRVVPISSNVAGEMRTDIETTNASIEQMLDKAMHDCRELLTTHRAFLEAVAAELMEDGVIEPAEFVKLAHQFGIACEEKSESWVIIEQYENMLPGKTHA